MSVTSQVPYKKYTAAPGATVFATTFRVVLATDLKVTVDGVVVTSGFTLSTLGVQVGLDVTFTTPMTGGEIVEFQRIIPKARTNDYQQLGDFQAATVNADIDRLWMSNQELGEEVSRAILVPIGSGIDPQDLIDELIDSAAAATAAALAAANNAVAAANSAIAAAASAAAISLPLPITSGGTGVTSYAALRTALGINDATTGDLQPTIATTAKTGWIFGSGRTIGNAASGATERANADTWPLFEMLYNGMTNTEAAVSGGRTTSAAADYALNKTIVVPDLRGRVIAGKDNMGGTTASRLTSGGSGITGTILGTAGGSQTHTLSASEGPVHSHTIIDPTHSHTTDAFATAGGVGASVGVQSGAKFTGAVATGITINNSTGGSAHNNTQPTYIANILIKL